MSWLASRLKQPSVTTGLCIVVLLLLPFTLFLPVTFGPYTLLPADNLYQYQPFRAAAAQFGITLPQNALLDDLILENYQWKRFILDSLRQGELPLWNPYLFAGVPFLAAGQHSAMYPLSALYYLLPLEKAYGWFTVIQLGLAGVFMFIFMRTLGLRPLSSLFAGVAWQLSGFMLVSVVFPMIIAAASWLPLILAMVERVIQQAPGLGNRPSSLPWVAVGALAIAMMALAGHVEMMVYTALVTVFYALWRISTVIGFRNLRVDGRFLLTRVVWLAAMGGFGIALAAVQIVPLYELVTRNFRGAGRSTFEQVLSYGFPARNVLLWLMPNIFGNPAHHTYFDLFSFSVKPVDSPSGNTWWGIKDHVEGGVYVGVITLLLAGMGIVTAARNALQRARAAAGKRAIFPTWFFVVLGLICVLFIFGTPFYAVLYYGLPGVDQLHSPFRWKFPLTLALAALAAHALDDLLLEGRAGRGRLSGMRLPTATARFSPITLAAPWVGVGVGGLVIVAVIIARLAWGAVRPIFERALANDLVQRGFRSPEAFFSYTAGNLLLFGVLLIASSLVWRLLMAHRQSTRENAVLPVRFAPALSIGLLALDLNLGYVGFNPAVDPALLKHTPEAIAFLQRDQEGQWRFTAYEPAGSPAFKPMNMNMAWSFGLQDIRGYDSIIPRQYADYMRAIEPQGDLLYNRIGPIRDPRSLDSPLLDLLGVRYVVAEASTPIDNPAYEKVFDDGSTLIYRNTRALPRAFLLPLTSTVRADSFAEAIQRYDLRQFVLVAPEDWSGAAPAQPAQPQPASVTAYRNNEVWVDAPVGSNPSWLVLTDSYFPGWRAFVRPRGAEESAERELPIVRVNGNFRGVLLDPSALGRADVVTVRFRYSPDSFRFGAFISFLALATLLFLSGVYAWRNFPREARRNLTGVRRVARNSAILTVFNLGARLIDFAFALVMLRVLGPEGAGNFYFAVVVVGWFEIVMNFGLNTFLTREASRDRANAWAYLAQTSKLRLLLGAGVLPIVMLVVLVWRAAFDLAAEAEAALLILALAQVPASLSTGLSALFFAYERAETPAALTIATALTKAAIGLVFLLSGWGVIGLALTSLIVNLLTLGALWRLAQQSLPSEPTTGATAPARFSNRAVLGESFPLMLNHLLATLFFKVDVPMLQALRGAAVVGVYSSAYKFIDAFNIVPAFFTQSLFPVLSRLAAQDEDALHRSYVLAVKVLVMAALPLAVVTTFLCMPMVGVLGGAEFLPDGAIALAVMSWSMPIGWINSVTNYALIAANQQRALTRAFIIGLAFNVVTNALFIPLFSYVAAAVTTIASEIVEGAAFYFYVRRHIGAVDWVEVLARPFLATGAMAAVAGVFYAAGLTLLGLGVGTAVYVSLLWLLRAFNADERAILRPLVQRA
ncbi:MAG: oligosaccharide flippase family protein [Thermoflexales bacterium]|nr:oligosaccharide flippase family protein [Thermoflexales bacterium]